jgi:cellulose synthase/poly-beta-1,6-N-acetylglucosamine synthase-like glycosyltransferase
LEKGYRIVFEPEAIAYEETTEKSKEEFRMRVRVITRGMRGLLYMKMLFNPFHYPFVSLQLLSHKVLRWFIPVFLAVALVSNLFLAGVPFYNATLALQLSFYALALIGFVAEKRNILAKPLTIPLYFVTVNLAAVVAMYRIWKGHKAVTWETVRK